MFEDLTDGELIDLHKKGDIDAFPALFDRYRQMIRGLSSSYFLVGGDRDDLMQEGMLGLLKAVNTYNPEAGTAFSTFAHLCIGSGMKTAVKRSLSAGNYPLNVSSDLSEEGDKLVSEIDPEKTVIGKEDEEEFDRKISATLSSLEYGVLRGYLAGLCYREIAEKLGVSEKAVDNALFRIRKKLQ